MRISQYFKEAISGLSPLPFSSSFLSLCSYVIFFSWLLIVLFIILFSLYSRFISFSYHSFLFILTSFSFWSHLCFSVYFLLLALHLLSFFSLCSFVFFKYLFHVFHSFSYRSPPFILLSLHCIVCHIYTATLVWNSDRKLLTYFFLLLFIYLLSLHTSKSLCLPLCTPELH